MFSLNATLQFTQAVDFNGNRKHDLLKNELLNGDILVPFFNGPDNRAGVIALTNDGAKNDDPGNDSQEDDRRGNRDHRKFKTTILLADPFYVSAGQKAAAIGSHGPHEEIHGILAPFSPAPSTGDSVFAFFPAQGDSWGKPIYFDVPNGKGAQAVVTADFNGDGRADFAGVDDNNELLVFLNTTNRDTCAFPRHAGVRICSPDSDSDSENRAGTAGIHASASGRALPIAGMKAFVDDKLVSASDLNTLDATVQVQPGRHVLTVSAADPNGKVYQSRVAFRVQ